MQLFFIYDTEYCKGEDDPKDSVIYFYPSQACKTQRYALCCQLVGVARFLATTFSKASVVALEQGKFAFYQSEKYLVVLGGNTEIHNNVLKKQLTQLCNIFFFYHGSINNVLEHCNNDRESFMEKIDLIWPHYLMWSQCFGNLMQYSLNALPLTTVTKQSSIATRASHLLQLCQISSTVTAGAIFCKNKILATQLTPELTSYLMLMSNINASAQVCDLTATDNLPPGVQLKYAYLTHKEIENILKFNHQSVGNSFRVRHTPGVHLKHSISSIHRKNISSGSDADVDSGNCSESLNKKHSRKEAQFLRKESLSKDENFNICPEDMKLTGKIHNTNQQSPILNSGPINFCCRDPVNVPLYILKLNPSFCPPLCFVCDNKLSMRYNARDFTKEKHVNVSQIPAKFSRWKNMRLKKSQKFSTFSNGYASPTNVLCNYHSLVYAQNVPPHSESERCNQKSSHDLEFCCYMCSNYVKNGHSSTLRRWKSETFVSDVIQTGHLNTLSMLHYFKCFLYTNCTHTSMGKCSNCHHLQFLRCRSASDNYSHRSVNTVTSTKKSTRQRYSSTSSDFSSKSSDSQPLSELRKTILYIQQCGSSCLLLFLSKNHDENLLNYLWNCGFSILKDLEFDLEKEGANDNCKSEQGFSVMLYDTEEKILKEDSQNADTAFVKNISKSQVQQIREDFQSDPNLCAVSVLSTNRSMFASQSDQHVAFYIQPDGSRKLDLLPNLSKKAPRKIRCFGAVPQD